MYTFRDKGDRSITLKPEGTAPAVRAYVENSLGAPGQITRLYYVTPIFRYDRPQKGRYRESHQTGVELIGSASASADAEVITLTARFYEELGLTGLTVKLNSLGDKGCREAYTRALLDFARPVLADLPAEFRERCENNPLRLLDSKDEAMQAALTGAPTIDMFLEPEAMSHFDELLALLDAVGVRYEVSLRLVRGLDYYTRTVFEVLSDALGAQSSLCGGGRYDNLIAECGGPATPAVGVAMGIERALMVLAGHAVSPIGPKAFAVCLTENKAAFTKIVEDLRTQGVTVQADPDARSAKSQFRQADRVGAEFAIVIGDEELASGHATLKRLADADESKVEIATLASHLLDKQ